MNLGKYKHIVFSMATGSLLLVGLFLLLNVTSKVAHAAPDVLFVLPSGSGDCSQGNPCDLQTALGTTSDGDTIYIAGGVYTGSGGAVVTVTHSLYLYGGWDGTMTMPVVRDPDVYPTTLDGEDMRRVVYISGNISPTIDGLIVTGGKAPDGGGLYIYDASPIIQNNVITANRTITSTYDDGRGGGIFVGWDSDAIITQNRILSNTSGYGGGIYHNSNTAITITANEITDNTASYRGGGILVENAPDMIQNNVISGNSAEDDGGGMLIWNAALQAEANHVVGNSAHVGGGFSLGNDATPSILNNLIISNTKSAIYVSSSSPLVINNTIVGSGLTNSGYGFDLRSSSSCTPPYCTTGSIINNIVISYEIGIRGNGPITPVIDYNDVWGNITADYSLPSSVVSGTHNISLDPLFNNPAADDYHLQSGSPCVDAGDPVGVPPAPPTDIDGDTRPTGARVDIGADEFQFKVYFLPVVLRSYAP
ncbi:MAG: right-handed parallel beta-helix repeat-containing protein [Chloroflexota bacterium]|nr:right-handed parallel beta-helix repeat-containing protein [Chloroflexota bacterium]